MGCKKCEKLYKIAKDNLSCADCDFLEYSSRACSYECTTPKSDHVWLDDDYSTCEHNTGLVELDNIMNEEVDTKEDMVICNGYDSNACYGKCGHIKPHTKDNNCVIGFCNYVEKDVYCVPVK